LPGLWLCSPGLPSSTCSPGLLSSTPFPEFHARLARAVGASSAGAFSRTPVSVEIGRDVDVLARAAVDDVLAPL
jgi:hypothetical protein